MYGMLGGRIKYDRFGGIIIQVNIIIFIHINYVQNL